MKEWIRAQLDKRQEAAEQEHLDKEREEEEQRQVVEKALLEEEGRIAIERMQHMLVEKRKKAASDKKEKPKKTDEERKKKKLKPDEDDDDKFKEIDDEDKDPDFNPDDDKKEDNDTVIEGGDKSIIEVDKHSHALNFEDAAEYLVWIRQQLEVIGMRCSAGVVLHTRVIQGICRPSKRCDYKNWYVVSNGGCRHGPGEEDCH